MECRNELGSTLLPSSGNIARMMTDMAKHNYSADTELATEVRLAMI